MRQLAYLIENLAPICFNEQNGDSVLYETRRYIPGSSILGALAAKYISQNKLGQAHKDALFKELFLSGKVRFLPAYPATMNGRQSLPLPLSLMLKKDGRSVVDYAAAGSFAAGCKRLTGFGVVSKSKKTLAMLNAKVGFEFHMSRASDNERLSGSSNDGKVFNYEYLEPFQYFHATVVLDDDVSTQAVAALQKLLNEKAGMGKSRSAQYGMVQLAYEGEQACQCAAATAGRLALYAYSPFIPSESWSRTDELAAYIADELNAELAKCGSKARFSKESCSVFAASEAVTGFVGIWNSKRERKNALALGSLFIFEVADIDADAMGIIVERLYRGMGERVAEGFGQFRIWQPLENSGAEGWQKQDLAIKNSGKPSLAAVRTDACAIIAARIMEEIRLQAKNDALSMSIPEKGKGTLKRLEALADSDKSKKEIMYAVKNFRKTAKENLFRMRLDGAPLLHRLLEEENYAQPYAGIDWLRRIGIAPKQIQALRADLDMSDIPLTEDEIFKEYWLWFARHGVKKMKKVQESGKFYMGDARVPSGKEEA